jgi:metal-responsive CopG/Arc/MetJ family transcriptional regulator
MSKEKILVSIDVDLLKRLDTKVYDIGMDTTRSAVVSAAVESFLLPKVKVHEGVKESKLRIKTEKKMNR